MDQEKGCRGKGLPLGGLSGYAKLASALVDPSPVYAQHFPSPSCLHNCGPLVFQESPIVMGDKVRIDNLPNIPVLIRSLLWNRNTTCIPLRIAESFSSSRPAICWRTGPKSTLPRTLSSFCKSEYPKDSRTGKPSAFRYPALGPAPDAIRLVEIHSPTTNDGMINASLLDARLSHNPYFYAISYEWGPAEGLQTILLNGRPFQVRRNLFDFLTTYNDKGGARTLWIDSICINQEDTQERNRQVSIMGDIYRTATSVQLWLGNEADNSGALLRHLRQEGTCIREFGQVYTKDSRDVRVMFEKPPSLEPTPPVLRQHVTALGCLLRRSYWTRAWITQELVLARDINIHCGRETISWSYMRALADDRCTWSRYFQDTTLCKILWHKFTLTTDNRISFLHILSLYPDRKCQDPRDQVYSLLSLDHSTLRKDGKTTIEVDYDIDLCSFILRAFNACRGILTRDAANFERLRLALGLGWDVLLDATHKPRYVKDNEPWFNADRPFDVFAQVGLVGRVVTTVSLSAGSCAGIQYITSSHSYGEYGLARHAEVGDLIVELFGTSLRLLCRFVDQELCFIAPMIRLRTWSVKPEDIDISDFEHQLLLSSLFYNDSPASGWTGTNFVRLNLFQWAAACGCLEEGTRSAEGLPPAAGCLPDIFWKMAESPGCYSSGIAWGRPWHV